MFLSRMMMAPPVLAASWLYQFEIEAVLTDQVGFGTGYGGITPGTFEGATIEYLTTYPGTPLVRARFGGTTFASNILFEIEGLAGVYTLATATLERYVIPSTDPDDNTVQAYIIANSGNTLGVNLTLA